MYQWPIVMDFCTQLSHNPVFIHIAESSTDHRYCIEYFTTMTLKVFLCFAIFVRLSYVGEYIFAFVLMNLSSTPYVVERPIILPADFSCQFLNLINSVIPGI